MTMFDGYDEPQRPPEWRKPPIDWPKVGFWIVMLSLSVGFWVWLGITVF